MAAFDYQCVTKMGSRDDYWNYVGIDYANSEQSNLFSIRISPQDVLFDMSKATPIQMHIEGIASNEAQYYRIGNLHNIKFIDSLNNDIVITSELRLETTRELVSQLRYTGNRSNINPWEKNCQ